jgi:hypothetical protein
MRAKSEDPQSKQMVVFFEQRKSHLKNDHNIVSTKVCSIGRGHWPLNHCHDHHRTASHIDLIQSLEIGEPRWPGHGWHQSQATAVGSPPPPSSVIRLHAKFRARRPPSTYAQTSQPGDSLSRPLSIFGQTRLSLVCNDSALQQGRHRAVPSVSTLN